MTVAVQNLENLGSVRAKLNEVIAASEITSAAEMKRVETVETATNFGYTTENVVDTRSA